MRRKPLIVGALIALGLGVPVAVKFAGADSAQQVDVAKVEKRLIQPVILATGHLVFRQEVQLSAEVIGKVAEVLVKEGDMVKKGQVLMRLDPTVYEAEVAQQEANRRSAAIAIERAQINVANQQRSLERTARLYKEKFVNVSAHDEALHQADLARVELRASREHLGQASALLSQARERLAKTEVRAPISGTVTAVPIKVGETAVASATGIAGSSLMTIADVGSIVAEVNVDEADVARVAVGQSAKVFPAAFPDKPVRGTVESVAMVPKPALPGAQQGRNYVVKLRLEEAGVPLRSGMTSRVEIATAGGTPRPAIPLQAVLNEERAEGKDKDKGEDETRHISYVFAVAGNQARRKEVTLGVSDDANQEIIKGLDAGERVVVGPARVLHKLRDGQRIAVNDAPAGGAAP
jgi:HlyD family secretion protein